MSEATLDWTEPWSTVSAGFYLAVAAALLWAVPAKETVIFAAALGLLTAGTGYFHATPWPEGQTLDHAGMNATYVALATYAAGGTWWVMLLGAAIAAFVVEVWMNRPNYVLMGACVFVAYVAAGAAGEYLWLTVSVLLMGSGFIVWQDKDDLPHAAWHLLTAAGTGVLYWTLT